MSKQTRLIGYRNSKHCGYTKLKSPEGIGFLLDDLFLFALSHWKQYRMNGHTVVIYPNREILYTIFENDAPKGLWSFFPNKQTQIFGAGVDANHTQKLAVYPQQSNAVIQLQTENRILAIKKEHTFSNQDQKWRIISDILSTRIDPSYYTLYSFIQKHFIEPSNNELKCNQNRLHTTYKFGMEQSLGFCLGSQGEVEEVGEYHLQNLAFGRRYTETGRKDEVQIEEGVFEGEKKNIIKYRDKRENGRKMAQDYFRQSTNFVNKFVYMVAADDFYTYITPKVAAYTESLSSSFGQKIIESNQISSNKQYNLQEAKKAIYGEISKKNSSKRSGGYDTSRRQRSPGTERRKYAYNDEQPNQIRVAQFRINEQIALEERRRLLQKDEQIRIQKRMKEEEQRMILMEIEKENQIRRKMEEENQMRKKLRQLQMEKEQLDKAKIASTFKNENKLYGDTPYLSTFGHPYLQSNKIMRERQKNVVYPKRQINYLDEKPVQIRSRSKSRSRTPIKGINSTARNSRISPHKPSKRNYKYID